MKLALFVAVLALSAQVAFAINGQIWVGKSTCDAAPAVTETVKSAQCVDRTIPMNGNNVAVSVRVTCDSATTASAWTAEIFLTPGCVGGSLPAIKGTGAECTAGSLLVASGAFKINCADATVAPTAVPTARPTVAPTSKPTDAATTAPTKAATTAPTNAATAAPVKTEAPVTTTTKTPAATQPVTKTEAPAATQPATKTEAPAATKPAIGTQAPATIKTDAPTATAAAVTAKPVETQAATTAPVATGAPGLKLITPVYDTTACEHSDGCSTHMASSNAVKTVPATVTTVEALPTNCECKKAVRCPCGALQAL